MLHEISCNAAISACENDGEKTSALSLLSSTPRMGKMPHETSYSAAISADENDGGNVGAEPPELDAQDAEDAPRGQLQCRNSTCENDGEKTSALSLLCLTPRMGKMAHETSCNAAISACENDGE